MSLKTTLINALANIILGSHLFDRIKACVVRQEEKLLSGPEKRHAVLQELMLIGISAASYLVNLGIELAVTQLKELTKEKK